MYQKEFVAGWAEMDMNAHMANTSFLDKAVDIRMMFFADNGFSMQEFLRLRIGPVVMKDEVFYKREIQLLEPFLVDFKVAGLSTDGSRMKVRNEFFRQDGQSAAIIVTLGGWMDLAKRKLTIPPEALLKALQTLEKTEDYQELPSSIKDLPSNIKETPSSIKDLPSTIKE